LIGISWKLVPPSQQHVEAEDISLGFGKYLQAQFPLRVLAGLDEVCTPKPCIMRRLRGIPRSDMTHISVCVVSGLSEAKSQKVSCTDAACGIPLCGSGLTAWTRSGNFMASWMKNTGVILPAA
jgi:hypothetical protein